MQSNSIPALDSDIKIIQGPFGYHLFVADGSRVYGIDQEVADYLRQLSRDDLLSALEHCGINCKGHKPWIGSDVPADLEVRAISLNVAQACNMKCRYCYADEGRFGGASRYMCAETARKIVDRLVSDAPTSCDLLLGFIGGEPLLNRKVICDIVPYATQKAKEDGKNIRFSITTNGTQITKEDAQLFSEYPFSVQVSLDGGEALTKVQRPLRNGSGSYGAVTKGVRMLTTGYRPRHLTARATVTAKSIDLCAAMEDLAEMQFDEIGFGFAFTSASPEFAIVPSMYPSLLASLKACAQTALIEWKASRRYPFGNLLSAVREIHRGVHRPYPCGAGAAYLSADTNGNFFACHRFVGNLDYMMGDVSQGYDAAARTRIMIGRHVDRQFPCTACWARYICGGGCHHEITILGRNDAYCTFIKGWIETCLEAYVELAETAPELLTT